MLPVTPLLIRFGIHLWFEPMERGSRIGYPDLPGPLFHQWLPDGEKDAVVLDQALEFKAWFVRRGYIRDNFIEFDDSRREVDPDVMSRPAILQAGPLVGKLRVPASPKEREAVEPGFPFWILASSILRSFSLEGKPFLTAGTHRAGPKCLHWTLSFSEGDNSSVGRQFFRHSSELHSAASRFRTRERPFYPLGSGSAQILCSMSPNSLRFRCPSANNNQ